MISYPTAAEIIAAIAANQGEENTLQYLQKGHDVYELYYGQGAYCSWELAQIFDLHPPADYATGLNPLFIHLTERGLRRTIDECDGKWVLLDEAE